METGTCGVPSYVLADVVGIADRLWVGGDVSAVSSSHSLLHWRDSLSLGVCLDAVKGDSELMGMWKHGEALLEPALLGALCTLGAKVGIVGREIVEDICPCTLNQPLLRLEWFVGWESE
ncbi:hypothetical protein KIPB_014855 [Kipferlia bialata]|uniref:Uncharacterized protein n=1 Tax=Kipferlia bialata TaxID=797122 RepID=A0A391NXC1_9EUKA|nr:hypothetical protein KIPB_014855 [Kipferlia bialata]|eukprot:g14855.t1